MLNIIKTLFMAVFNLLPDDPFISIVDGVVYDVDFLPTLNFFVPFDICATMLLGWLDCILVYYAFMLVKKIVLDYVLSKVLSAITAVFGGMASGGI